LSRLKFYLFVRVHFLSEYELLKASRF
jgi:hypothetical protein